MSKRAKKSKKETLTLSLTRDSGTWLRTTSDAVDHGIQNTTDVFTRALRTLGSVTYDCTKPDELPYILKLCLDALNNEANLQFSESACVSRFIGKQDGIDEWIPIPGGPDDCATCFFFFGSHQRSFELKANAPDDAFISRIAFQTENNSLIRVSGLCPREQYKYRIPSVQHDVGPMIMITFVIKVR